ncbi:hypothetical protein MPSEU_001015500 [Mayamaea pseudoterrestris]|nr:hypothetical protein MPSEU_001015500 [Mayamaea pseudoterrestris]
MSATTTAKRSTQRHPTRKCPTFSLQTFAMKAPPVRSGNPKQPNKDGPVRKKTKAKNSTIPLRSLNLTAPVRSGNPEQPKKDGPVRKETKAKYGKMSTKTFRLADLHYPLYKSLAPEAAPLSNLRNREPPKKGGPVPKKTMVAPMSTTTEEVDDAELRFPEFKPLIPEKSTLFTLYEGDDDENEPDVDMTAPTLINTTTASSGPFIVPRPLDVRPGKSKDANNHTGNVEFLSFLTESTGTRPSLKEEYMSYDLTKNGKAAKKSLAKSVFALATQNQFRFLAAAGNGFVVMEDEAAIKRVQVLLGEGAHTNKK